nr:immunoglobulin-like and fibronectin type III domain-containing protein 1 [Nerophis lumbriciformis]
MQPGRKAPSKPKSTSLCSPVAIQKRSKVHGVVITQHVEKVPLGKSTPDFVRKPMAMTVHEGKRAFFKATVEGDPQPTVTWGRGKEELINSDEFRIKFNEKSRECLLEIPSVKAEYAEVYKCFVTNEYGQAVCNATLKVIKGKEDTTQDFRSMLKKTKVVTRKKKLAEDGEIDPKLWELLLSARKKDYQKICLEFGITDFRFLLTKLNQKKKAREDEQAKVVENLRNFKRIEMTPLKRAAFSLEMTVRNPNSKIYLYKDGNMVQFGSDDKSKYRLLKRGDKYYFSIKDPKPEDAGFYQVDVDDTTVFSTHFRVPEVDFVDMIKDAKAVEGKDATFQCVLSAPLNEVTWSTPDSSLEHSDKYEMTVSEDKLVHTLTIKNCDKSDHGQYFAFAGTASSSAMLRVEADLDALKIPKVKKTEAPKPVAETVTEAKSPKEDVEKEVVEKEVMQEDSSKEITESAEEPKKADEGVQFVSGLSDTSADIGQRAELCCTLSTEDSQGKWYKNGKPLTGGDGLKITQDGANHRLIIDCCQKDDVGAYGFEADGRKSEATLTIRDPPKIDSNSLGEFSKPVTVKAGESAKWKLLFSGGKPLNMKWYKDDNELAPAPTVKIDKSSTSSKLCLTKCQRKDSGEVKLRIKNEFGTTEAVSRLIVLDKPVPPQGPVDIVESGVTSIEFKWNPPKDNGGCPVTNYIVERQQIGRNKWTTLGEIGGSRPEYRDSNVDPGRRYCYRIRARNSEGISDFLQTEDISAGALRYPGAPSAPKVVCAFKDCISLKWSVPSDTGGIPVVGYNLERRKKGSSYWSLVNQGGPIKEPKYEVKDVIEGAAYEFRVSAINLCGHGDPSLPSDAVTARDPMKVPGKVTGLKVASNDYTTLSLAWTKPKHETGSHGEPQGYYVEIRPVASSEWVRCNALPVTPTTYTVHGLIPMAAYFVRVIATNYGGDGEPQSFDKHIIAMPPPVRPQFKDRKIKSFVVVKSGNTLCLNIPFEASPLPEVSWLKDGGAVGKHVTITNFDKGSQMLIPMAQRSDSGVYTITVKNLVGQESINVEIRVTDDPKPPGPLELEQIVPGTVTLSWAPSPDEKKDDRLHYSVSKRDSFKRTWKTVADGLYNNKFTVIDIVPGREYHFRVFAQNDMGPSVPAVSPPFEIQKEREKFKVNMPRTKPLDLSSPAAFIKRLRRRTPPEGYECHMSCAVKGDPTPRVTWYRNNISVNTDANYFISNVCGVCSLLILRVGPKDGGEYKVVVDNGRGLAESSMILFVRE